MQELIRIIESLEKMLGEKESKRLQIGLLKRLMKKTLENSIEDKELLDKIKKLSNDLRLINEGDTSLRKKYKKDFRLLKESIKKKYGYAPKGTYIGTYMSIGIVIGTAIGKLGMGIAIGTAIGSLKEKKAGKEGKLY